LFVLKIKFLPVYNCRQAAEKRMSEIAGAGAAVKTTYFIFISYKKFSPQSRSPPQENIFLRRRVGEGKWRLLD
jgi:hypothetical protein